MSSDVFWRRWWALLTRQPAIWWFALVSQMPVLVLSLVYAPVLLLLPPFDAPPEVWDHWLQQKGNVLLGVGIVIAALALLLGLATWLLGVWADAGILTLVRRVWGREEEPVPWSEARQGLRGPFVRALAIHGLYAVLMGVLALVWFGLVAGTLIAAIDSDSPGPFLAVLFGSLCLALPLGFAVAPWLATLRVAVVVEYPAGLRETWEAFLEVGRRGWPGLYAMLVVHIVVSMALSMVVQMINIPVQILAVWMSDLGNSVQVVVSAVSMLLRVLVTVVLTAVMTSGWAALYLHYRLGGDAAAEAAQVDDAGAWPPADAAEPAPEAPVSEPWSDEPAAGPPAADEPVTDAD